MSIDDLARNLTREVRGEVRFDKTSRILYSTDASLYQIMPVGVVVPRDAEDVAAAVRLAAQAGVPVVPRGSGTSLGGQTVGAAVVLDVSKSMNRILELDTRRRQVRVQPGVILDHLNRFLKPYGLQFAPDVATSNRASIGGMIGNNSCGAHSIRYGKTVDHVIALDVVLANGEAARLEATEGEERKAKGDNSRSNTGDSSPFRLSPSALRLHREVDRIVAENREEIERRFPMIMRRVGGYNLDRWLLDGPRNLSHLVVGSEGTLATVTAATLDLVPLPRSTALSILHFDDLIASLEATREILRFEPAAVELTDKYILDLTGGNLELAPAREFLVGDPQAILMVEFSGDNPAEVEERLAAMEAHLRERVASSYRPYAAVRAMKPAEQAQAWRVRKAGLGLLMGMKGEQKPVGFVEDTAVAPEVLPEYIRRFQGILREFDAEAVFYAHASVGCLHVRPILNLKRPEDRGRMRAIAERVCDLVLEFGGAMSAEHGDGLVRSEWSEKLFGQ
jgi:FAD/FMN-containing dehydrogenase